MIIVFDLMGTLVHDPYRTAYAEAAGCTFEEFQRARPPELYHALERGEITEAAYWRALRASGLSIDPHRFHRLRRQGQQWLPGMRRLVADCAALHRTVIGSNYPVWIRQVARDLLGGLPIEVHASCDLGVRKPAAGFFEEIARRAGHRPQDLLLIDDKSENTRALEQLGGLTVTFTDSRQARAQLRGHGLLP
ncbi:hypothetical protein E6W39_00155 [Kitasatospora acidiphila]|uniref:Hydrolase n=1 Tax=Kitasatospora acidiphila TaxID=2567942 RepID=A0A540WG51_9ACTN|nr:HAD family hydrolase [Kitasatospora acidiphila]TQF08009.1 hypothetical protein E6W39_00155 [Kitasatospora acidiphila]